MAKKKFKFKIGDFVKVSGSLSVGYNGDKRRITRIRWGSHNDFGQVVGATFLPLGFRTAAHWDEPSHFAVKGKKVFVWLVRMGLLNKSIRVLEEDLEKVSDIVSSTEMRNLPNIKKEEIEWSRRDREVQRQIMKTMPRDKNGRWVKC